MVVLAGPVQRDPLDDHRPLPPAEGEAVMTRRSPAAALLPRRGLGAPALVLGGCDRLGASPSFRDIVLGAGEWLSYRAHRLIGARGAGPRVRPAGDVAGLPHQRQHRGRARRSGGATRRRASPAGGFGSTGSSRRRRRFSLAELQRDAGAQPDHPARLRRGLERHRQVDGRAARRTCSGAPRLRPRGALSSSSTAPTTSHRLSGCPTTRASTSSTPSTRRRSSPGA